MQLRLIRCCELYIFVALQVKCMLNNMLCCCFILLCCYPGVILSCVLRAACCVMRVACCVWAVVMCYDDIVYYGVMVVILRTNREAFPAASSPTTTNFTGTGARAGILMMDIF